MAPIRVYADTSVFGGVFDPEFTEHSKAFFEKVRSGEFELVISPLVDNELQTAPQNVRDFFAEYDGYVLRAEIGQAADQLKEAYLRANIVTRNSEADAMHVAIASAAGCRMIVSWNFKHIVNYRRIPLYNGVNIAQGFFAINIYSPLEIEIDGD